MTRRVFITGGASGFGRALAEHHAREGWRVCIGDIHEERLAETLAMLKSTGAPGVHAMRCDVTKEADLQAVADWLEEHWGGVDVVVNNAGVAAGGGIADLSLEDWQWIMDINVLGVVRGCRVFTPLMRRQGSGRFVNVASIAGLVHPPMMAAYNATKAAVVAISETLRFELASDNIGVSVVCPAFFRTNLTETFRTPSPRVRSMTERLVNRATVGAPEIAAIVYRAVDRGDFLILTHPEGKRAFAMKRFAPSRVYHAAMLRSTRRMIGPRKGSGLKEPDAHG